jgi:hypothetical protein
MSEIERLHQQRLEREAEAKQRGERKDPTEWRPRGSGERQVDANMVAQHVRSEPLNYGSLVGKEDSIAGIEANARGDLIRAMERQGITVGERGVRSHWQLVVEGYGFPYPEGFVHPEAPDEVKAEGRSAWKRVVEIASDSMQKYLFVKVWRPGTSLPPAAEPKAIEDRSAGRWCSQCQQHGSHHTIDHDDFAGAANDRTPVLVHAEVVEECTTCGTTDGTHVMVEDCDDIDDIQDHHDWDYGQHGGTLGVCNRCGALSQGWEE